MAKGWKPRASLIRYFMSKAKKASFASFLLALIILASFPVSALAQESTPRELSGQALRMSPAYIDVTVGTLQDEEQVEFTLENRTKHPMSIDLFSLDFQQKDELGSIGFLGREIGNYTYSLSSFLTFKNPNVELEPGEKKIISVLITNRQDLAPGGHYAAVIARLRPTEGEVTAVSPAVSALIYLTKVGGERYNLSFKAMNWPDSSVVFSYPATGFLTLQNDGNTHLTPYGTADIYDMFNRKIYKGIINEGSVKVLPQSIRRVPVYFKKIAFSFPISVNTLKVEGRDSTDKTKFSSTEVFIYINPYVLGGMVLFIIFSVFGLKKGIRRVKNHV